MDFTTVTLLIFLLLILSALFSASETAVIGSSKPKLHTLEREGNQQAGVVNKLRRNMGKLISSLLVGGTLVNIAASSVATGLMVNLFGDAGVVYATFIMGILIVVYGEIMPKVYAVNNPEKVAIFSAPFLKFIVKILNPITAVLDLFCRRLLSLFGVRTYQNIDSYDTAEELRGMIALHVGPNEETAHERAMLRSILDLATVNVEEIMIHRKDVFMIDINEGVSNIITKVLNCPYTRVPLWRDNNDNIVSVLHVKALFKALKEADNDVSKINIYEVASKPWFIPATTTLLDQLQEFRKRREHFAHVVDEYGAHLGIVTLEDILEEIVGEIVDEHDIELSGVRQVKDGSYVVSGTVTIRALNRQFEWNLPDEEAATIAGLIMHESRQIPEVGQKFIIHGFHIEILRRQRNQITLLRLTPTQK
jgi:Mg2+/Co2+ transporter CorB